MENRKVALVTGASGGIGQAVARGMAREGWRVYGTSRGVAVGEVVEGNGIAMMRMDVTDDDSVSAAVALILAREGRLDAVVNNAGSGIAGAIEDTSAAEAIAQFDANFFGVVRVCRATLPYLNKTGGIIINISSVAAATPIAYQAMYSASKAALEALSAALRIEAAPQGVRVTSVLPGDTRTGFTTARRLTATVSPHHEARLRRSLKRMEHDEQNGAPPQAVAAVVCRMARRSHPPVRVAVGAFYKLVLFLKRLLPDRTFNWILGLLYG